MVRVKVLRSIFDRSRGFDVDVDVEHEAKPAADYRPVGAGGRGWYLIRNGKAHSAAEAASLLVRDGDELTFVGHHGGPGVLAFVTQFVVGLVVATALSVVVQLLIGKPNEPEADDEGSLLAPLRNRARRGKSIPAHYGQHTIAGDILSWYTTVDTDGNTFGHVLLSLGAGRVDELGGYTESFDDKASDDAGVAAAVKLDGNSVEAYSDVKVSFRPGTLEQTAIPGFNELHSLQVIQANLEQPLDADGDPIGGGGEWVRHTTTSPVDSVVVQVGFPQGLYDPDDKGLDVFAAFYDVRYRLDDAGGGTPGAWSYVVWNGVALTYTTTPTEGLAIPVHVISMRVAPFTSHFRLDLPARDTYQVEVRRRNRFVSILGNGPGIGFNDTDSDQSAHRPPNAINAMQLTAIDEITEEALAYPEIALLAVHNIDLRQTNGSLPTITTTGKWRRVRVWDGVDPTSPTYAWEWTQNPAWICLDALIDEEVGAGAYVAVDEPSLESLADMATYCDRQVDDGQGGTEDFAHWDGTLTGETSLWEFLRQVCSTCWVQPVVTGGKVRFKVQQTRPRTQLFTMGNIGQGGFRRAFINTKNAPNQVTVQYRNGANDDEPDAAVYELAVVETGGEPLRAKTYEQPGVLRTSQALRNAKFLALLGRSVDEALEIPVGLDALTCEVMDRVGVAHDVPDWTASGRVADGSTSTTIKLDVAVTLAAATTYHVLVRHPDDTLEEKTVTSPAGDYAAGDAISVDSAWIETPALHSPWSLGPASQVVRDFLVADLTRKPDLSHDLSLVTYDASIYTDALDIDGLVENPTPTNPDEADAIGDPPASVAATSITFTQPSTVRERGGIRVVWSPASGSTVRRWAVFLRHDVAGGVPAPPWTLAGQVDDATEYVIVDDIIAGSTYVVSVVAVALSGRRGNPAAGTQATVTYAGKSGGVPYQPTPSAARSAGGIVTVEWGEPDSTPAIQRYLVRRGRDWRSAIPVASATSGRAEIFQYMPGGEHVLVKSVSAEGVESQHPLATWVDADPPPGASLALDYSAAAVSWSNKSLLGGSVDSLGRLQDDTGVVSWRSQRLDLGSEDDWLIYAGRWVTTRWLHLRKDSVRIPIGAVASGPFTAGETLTGDNSGATGVCMVGVSDGELYIYVAPTTGIFTSADTISGGTSGASADAKGGPASIPLDDTRFAKWSAAGPDDADGLTLGSLTVVAYDADGEFIKSHQSFAGGEVRCRYVELIATFGTSDTARFQAIAQDVRAKAWKRSSMGGGGAGLTTAAEIRALGFFDTSNDGAGSGLDADLLDGSHASAFATSAQGALADTALQPADRADFEEGSGATENLGTDGTGRFGDEAVSGTQLAVTRSTAVTNGPANVAKFYHKSSGTVVAGFAARVSAFLDNAVSTLRNAAAWEAEWTNATDTSEEARFNVYAMIAGTLSKVAAFSGSGLAMQSRKITGVADPTAAQDAATKTYVDAAKHHEMAVAALATAVGTTAIYVAPFSSVASFFTTNRIYEPDHAGTINSIRVQAQNNVDAAATGGVDIAVYNVNTATLSTKINVASGSKSASGAISLSYSAGDQLLFFMQAIGGSDATNNWSMTATATRS